ncbi:ArsR/SmtB family transcription factor [Solwaraspora sp. WMMB335]|uniref:ArsR/SmtB family transcription factor n=1 Tax=Solwaraspora sp. WMMB335 TaxID=3404118 RepID=UPI003B948A3C
MNAGDRWGDDKAPDRQGTSGAYPSVPRPDPSAHPGAAGDPPVPAVRVLAGVNELRAVADPIRLQVLGVLTAEYDHALSARQLARRLGVTFSLMHYHLRVLHDEGLVRVTNQQTGQGRAERCFQTAQLALRWDFPVEAAAGCDGGTGVPAGSGGDEAR